MARPVLLSNGEMHIGLNRFGLVHDFYYPYVGLENHSAAKGLRHRIGVYVDGAMYWLDSGNWEISFEYRQNVLVSHIVALHAEAGIRLEFDDCVDSTINVFLRSIHVFNLSDTEREVKLFMHQVFVISDSHMSDTVQYIPSEHVLMHYKGHRTFYVNAQHADGRRFDDFSVGLFGIEGHDGTFRDAEDGVLSRNGVEHGKVDSVLGLYMSIPAHSKHRVYYWVCAGDDEHEAYENNCTIKVNGPLHHILSTAKYWASEMKPALTVAQKVPKQYREGFINSTLLIKASMDRRGAVIASTDSSMLNYSRDNYSYCWPRDAVYVLWPLLRMGYTTELINFFKFCQSYKHHDDYMNHKYQADGARGPSWHPYIHGDKPDSPPIQTDETAGVIFLFGQYDRLHQNNALLHEFYSSLIRPMANFLAGFINEDNLPKPSYDLWEEKYLTTTYTTALTYGSLLEAAYLAERMGDEESAVRWQSVAEDMQEARDIFFDEDTNYFIKGFVYGKDGIERDTTVDSSSLYGIFMYGYFDMDDPRVIRSRDTLQKELVVDDVAVVRYSNDNYHKVLPDMANPWPVVSLWFAQYALECNDTEKAEKILDWVTGLMGSAGTLAEQYIPHTSEARSVNPLTWSQAEYLSTLLDMVTENHDEKTSP